MLNGSLVGLIYLKQCFPVKQLLSRIVGSVEFIQCSQCCGIKKLCGACDAEQHQQHPFHDRQYTSPGGFFQFLQPPESADGDGSKFCDDTTTYSVC